MAADVVGSAALAISLSFPRGVYSGGTLGLSEDLPAHARVYEAFVAAAAGGPAARPEGNVLVAIDKHSVCSPLPLARIARRADG